MENFQNALKKVLAAMLMIAMILSLAACSKEKTDVFGNPAGDHPQDTVELCVDFSGIDPASVVEHEKSIAFTAAATDGTPIRFEGSGITIENGTVVMEGNERLFATPMEKADVRRVLEKACSMEGVHPVLCRPDVAIIGENAPEEFRRNVEMYYASSRIVPDLLAVCDQFDDVCQVALYDEGDAEHHEYPVLKAQFESSLSVLLSGRIVGIVSRIPRRAARK